MALDTITLSSLIEELATDCGDWLEFSTTTNITTNTSVVSTELTSYDQSENDFFNDWWFYMNTTANAEVLRKVSDYVTASGTLTIRGANLAAESASQTCYLFKNNRTHYSNAIKWAVKRIYPALYKSVDNGSLVTGNILPTFDDWTSSSTLRWYTTSTGTLLRTNTAGEVRAGNYAVKFTAGAVNDTFYIDSDMYPRLLQLQDKSNDFYVWVKPEVADDASMVVTTIQADGTTQTFTSSTTCPAGYYSVLSYEDAQFNDDLAKVTVAFTVATNAKYVIFDSPYLGGELLSEYLAPYVDMSVDLVEIQMTGFMDEPMKDVNPFITGNAIELAFEVIEDANNKVIKLKSPVSNKRRLRIRGRRPLETLSDETDTLTIKNEAIPLLIALSKYAFYERELRPQSSEDVGKANYLSQKAYADYKTMLLTKAQAYPPVFVKSR
jgi:hypothetical protein